MEAASYGLMLWVRFKINPELGPPVRGITWSQRFRSLKGVWGMVVLIILVMGSIYTGLATPTESAAVGAIGAFLMALPRPELEILQGYDVRNSQDDGNDIRHRCGRSYFCTFPGLYRHAGNHCRNHY
ncbi:MAG: hypothetical protein CM1200mP18_20750 [Gammaproteobacteria bacterium]|nr:MAG: hypothetical protein CM1200mP18_20750 [Gammaproteobacteria bacterium]